MNVKLQPNWKVELLYDGKCPLCLREVNFLRQKDAGRGIISFVDIADDNYLPEEHSNIDFATAMGRIHAVLPDGTTIKNVAVFRRVYEELGMGWVYAITRLPLVSSISDRLYGIWADWRLTLTGRPNLATIIEQRQLECDSSRCQKNSKQ
jgi:predicted DCC family thiol-disulfide oxidoreductase YuxK